MAININDLPATSPHGSDFAHYEEFWDLHLIRTGHAAQQRHTVTRVSGRG